MSPFCARLLLGQEPIMQFANRLLESFTMIVMVAVWALASVVGLGCTFGAHDYPAPPRIGTQRQQQELANCARDALAESYPSRRLARLVELREVVAQIARSADTS